MKIHITREMQRYNMSHERKMTYERLAGLIMPDSDSSIKTRVRTLARMNAGESSHPDLQLVSLVAEAFGITIDQLMKDEIQKD